MICLVYAVLCGVFYQVIAYIRCQWIRAEYSLCYVVNVLAGERARAVAVVVGVGVVCRVYHNIVLHFARARAQQARARVVAAAAAVCQCFHPLAAGCSSAC